MTTKAQIQGILYVARGAQLDVEATAEALLPLLDQARQAVWAEAARMAEAEAAAAIADPAANLGMDLARQYAQRGAR